MREIHLNSYNHHDYSSFVHIAPNNDFHVLNDEYMFLEWSNRNFITRAFLIDVQTYKLKDLPNGLAYLAKNCDVELLQLIIKDQYRSRDTFETFINDNTLVDVLFFTKKENIKKLMEYEIKKSIPFDGEPKKRRMSKKPILEKTYKHKLSIDKEI